MISAIAKRRFAFRKPEGGFLTVVPNEFSSLPEWVKKDPIYALAVKEGSLIISETVSQASASVSKHDKDGKKGKKDKE
jgi:hypothetical protein